MGLAAIAVLSVTAGVYFEILILGLVISVPFMIYGVIRQPNLIWRVLFIGLLVLQIYYAQKQAATGNFESSYHGYLLDSKQIEKIKWIAPIAVGFCLTSFWTALINILKKNKKTLHSNS